MTGNNFTCQCLQGREGVFCKDVFCANSNTPCINDGYCLETELQPICQCRPGYAGQFCETDINECESDPCLNRGICTDIIAGYYCNCTGTGFEGVNCQSDIDECLMQQDDCGPIRLCINTEGSYK